MSIVMITGAAGFIGSNLVRYFLEAGESVVAVDSLTYAGRLQNLPSHPRLTWFYWDFSQPLEAVELKRIPRPDYLIHNGAESHVVRSFDDPERFIRSNILGTQHVLEFARYCHLNKFLYTSTDEVFGTSHEARTTGCRLAPANPYAATKAAGEYLVRSYRRCFDVPAVITRSINVFGPNQHEEKFIPMLVRSIYYGFMVFIDGDSCGTSGIRRWASTDLICEMIDRVLLAPYSIARDIQIYHLAEGLELSNLEMAQKVARLMGRELRYELVEGQRPVYDMQYGLQPSFKVDENFDQKLEKTVQHYVEKIEKDKKEWAQSH